MRREYDNDFPNNAESTPDSQDIFVRFRVAQFFVIFASIICDICERFPDRCPFTVFIAAITIDFLNHIDLNDPTTILQFLEFYYSKHVEYGARYCVDGKEYFTTNLGELLDLIRRLTEALAHNDVAKAVNLVPTIIMITAFATFDCLVKKPLGSLNGIYGSNPSVKSQRRHFRNGLIDATGKNVSEDAAQELREQHVFGMDMQLHHGIKNRGNDFKTFRAEVNEEGPEKAFFSEFKNEFDEMPYEGFMFDGKKVKTVEPVFLDLLNGFLLFALVALSIYAVTGKVVTAVLSSQRCRAVFEEPTNGEGVFTPRFLVLLCLCFGLHPDCYKYLGRKDRFDEGQLADLDKSYTPIITALAELGAEVEVGTVDGGTESVRIPAVSSRVHSETALASEIGKKADKVVLEARNLSKRRNEARAEKRALAETHREINRQLKPTERQALKALNRAEGESNVRSVATSWLKKLKKR